MADGFKKIPRIEVGGESLVSAKKANQIIDTLNAIGGGVVAPTTNVGKMLLAGPSFILDLSALDARLKKVERSTGTVATNVDFPFQISQLSNTVINVRYGTVSDLNVGNVATNITLGGTANYALYINATISNAGLVTSANVQWQANNKPADTTFQAYKLIGHTTVSSNNVTGIYQSMWFSQGFAACGRNTEDPNTAPGTYTFFVD